MGIERIFLDWTQPVLAAAAGRLIEESPPSLPVDLRDRVIVVPGRRARRRLLELLIERTQGRLLPPQIITEGEFPELLYEPQRPFAGSLVQQLAWAEAVRRLPRAHANRLLRDLPDDGDVDRWRGVGDLLWRLHQELAAERLNFADVLRQAEGVAGFNEHRRWEALDHAQQEYLRLLDEAGLWDRQTARLVAIRERECRTDKQIVLIGTVDLNRSTRAMLDQVADRVRAFIPAPGSRAAAFDEHGCLRPRAWQDVEIPLRTDQIRMADGPAEQAEEVLRALAALGGRYRADEIALAAADARLVPRLERTLSRFEVPTRWAVGKTLPQTGVYQLLQAIADYCEGQRPDQFAALVRHPSVSTWIERHRVRAGWLSELDGYLTEHLCHRLGEWVAESGRIEGLQQVHALIEQLRGRLSGEGRPLAEWSSPILEVLCEVLGHVELSPEDADERAEIEAIGRIREALAGHDAVPESLMPVVTAPQALRLLLDELSGESVTPPADESAIEMFGWLELPLDDAPAAVVTSVNEGFVPSSVTGDLFLPDGLRRQLGVLDNARRYARDAFAMSLLVHAREEVTLIAGRRDERGDPLVPSRLLFAADAATCARRVLRFFGSGENGGRLAAPGPYATEREISDFIIPRPVPPPQPIAELSVTALGSYLHSPFLFYLQYVLGLESIDDTQEEMSSRVFGTLAHRVLSTFGRSEIKDSTDAREIRAYLYEALEDVVHRRFGVTPLPAVSLQLEQLRQRLDAFAEWQARRAGEGWTIEYVESPADGKIPFPDDGEERILLRGRIDRIDRHTGDGRWAILDYKTGERVGDPDAAHRKAGEWIDLQLPLYRVLAQKLLDIRGSVQLGYLPLSRETGRVQERMAAWGPDDLADAERRAEEVVRCILRGEFCDGMDAGLSFWDCAPIAQIGVMERRLPE